MKWAKLSIFLVVILVVAGLFVKEYKKSQVVGHSKYRFNLATINPDKGVTFVSFDPAERSVLLIPFPTNLAITSRSSGEYSISSLYKLGSYTGQGGRFARQKIQGFMRVPVPGYIVGKGGYKSQLFKAIFSGGETSLSRFDALVLLLRSSSYKTRIVEEKELIRAGVIEDNKYKSERLQEYVGSRLFDWGIGGKEIMVSIVNASGENGLGSDMAEFLTNLGLDVVMVRSANSDAILEHSEWQIEDIDKQDEFGYIFQNLFELPKPIIEKIGGEYRSQVLIKVGKDAKNLF
jgi:hypothetical protein